MAVPLAVSLDRRYREGEPRSHPRPLALRPYPAPARLHDPLADGEAQARPGDAAPQVVAVGPGELPEQVRQSLGRYAPPLVGHRDRNVNVLPHYGHRDYGRLRGVSQLQERNIESSWTKRIRFANPSCEQPSEKYACSYSQRSRPCAVAQPLATGSMSSGARQSESAL